MRDLSLPETPSAPLRSLRWRVMKFAYTRLPNSEREIRHVRGRPTTEVP